MALEVGIVGLPNSGKTTLFNALTRAGAEITAYASVTDKPNVGMATIADDRLEQLAGLVSARKVTPAAIRMVDVPGTGPQLLGNLRQVDAILAVLDGFSGDARPDDDLETLRLELLVADRDHVERRHERVQKEAKSGDAAKRVDAETLAALLAHLDAGKTLADWPDTLPAELDPLTTKPLIAVENGPGGIDCKLEAELAELSEEEAAEFRDGPSALDEVVRRLKDALGLIAFFTAGEKETRALGHRARLHPLRGDLGGGFARRRVARGGGKARHATTRGQDLRGRRRRRPQHPLQRLANGESPAAGALASHPAPRRHRRRLLTVGNLVPVRGVVNVVREGAASPRPRSRLPRGRAHRRDGAPGRAAHPGRAARGRSSRRGRGR